MVYISTPAGKIDVQMKINGYEIHSAGSSGTMTPGLSLDAGEQNVITLKNEDSTAHGFVSKAFTGHGRSCHG